jgi:hypothetical protein
MTYNKPRPRNQQNQTLAPKPYKLISFPENPDKQLPLQPPIGQDKYHAVRCHGTLHITLTVQTALHVSTGVVAMGSDVGQKSIPLIKTMIQGSEEKLIIPGSSLKGVVRSTYEAITRSCLCKVSKEAKDNNWIPRELQECRTRKNQQKRELLVCPACHVFGAMDWQGLIHFTDARCQSVGFRPGFMPSLYRPRPDQSQKYFKQGKVAGRKFYYHTIRAVDKGQQQGIPVQQAAKEFVFRTELHYRNLTQAELGTLLIVLGQDKSKYPIALKVGGGKPIGMGTMTVEVTALEQPANLRDRYLSYDSEPNRLMGNQLQQVMQRAIQEAHRELVQSQQLHELSAVLKYPTDRKPPEEPY